MKIKKLQELYDNIASIAKEAERDNSDVSLLIASKTQPIEAIEPLLLAGHRLFGENRVQEATEKWVLLKNKYPDIILHLIGSLQTNKVKEAIKIFDLIETLDREKLALALQKDAPNIPCYIQVNTGEETTKSGITPQHFDEFMEFCRKDCKLNIQGLMCIPPVNEPSAPHFALLHDMASHHNLTKLSMGMSNDYELAIKMGATSIRIGSALFGDRAI